MEFSTYDPKRHRLVVHGVQIGGFHSGEFIGVDSTQDTFAMESGALGDIVRRRITDESGTFTVTLQQSSPSNDFLSGRHALDKKTGLGFGPIILRDLNGTTVASAAISWIRRLAPMGLADSVSGRVWLIDCAKLVAHVGGSLQVGL